MFKNGLTVGKFMPLHKGHELMLEVAVRNCSESLTILLDHSSNNIYPFNMRSKWIRDFLGSISTNITVYVYPDTIPDRFLDCQKDSNGTIIDLEFWSYWLATHKSVLSRIDGVFTSDVYGKVVASMIGAQWFPADPDREVYNISATEIREREYTAFNYVSDFAKPDVGRTICVVGAESTGKSTLVKRLAKYFDSAYAPEWGRIVSENKTPLTSDDFTNIVNMQKLFIKKAQLQSHLSFADTDATITAMFAPIYLGHRHQYAEDVSAYQPTINEYIIIAPTVPFVNDGTRVLNQAQRERFHSELVQRIRLTGKPYCVINDTEFKDREKRAIEFVMKGK